MILPILMMAFLNSASDAKMYFNNIRVFVVKKYDTSEALSKGEQDLIDAYSLRHGMFGLNGESL